MRKQAKRGEVPCSRSHRWQLARMLSRLSKACLEVKLDTLYGFSQPRVFRILCPSSSNKRSLVNPVAWSPLALPVSLISYNTHKLQGGKEMRPRKPLTPVRRWGPLLSMSMGCTPLLLSLRIAGAERQTGRSLPLLPVNTRPSFNNSPLATLPTTQIPVSITKALGYRRHRWSVGQPQHAT